MALPARAPAAAPAPSAARRDVPHRARPWGPALLAALAALTAGLPAPLRATPLPDEWPLAVPPPQLPPGTAVAPVLIPDARSDVVPDALSAGRPALVPEAVAVADLSGDPALRAAAPLLAAAAGWLYPLTLEPQEQDPWGWRWSESRQRWRMHTGVDLLVPEGSAVLAAQEGRVLLAEDVGGYGLTVLLDHADGWQTLYGHLSAMAVRSGERVTRGQRLGLVGATGNASAPHLHLELRRRQGAAVLAHNPLPLLRAPRPAPALAALPSALP